MMLADASGHVASYAAGIDDVPQGDLQACPVTVIDQGELVDTASRRGESLEALDATLRRIVKEADLGTRVLVAGVSAGPVGEPGLQVVVDWRPEVSTSRWLHSPRPGRTGSSSSSTSPRPSSTRPAEARRARRRPSPSARSGAWTSPGRSRTAST
ncbi:hypothetical protein NKG05_10155 [Oerskovia sp. M15]